MTYKTWMGLVVLVMIAALVVAAPRIKKDGVEMANEETINFISGTGVTVAITRDGPDRECDITIDLDPSFNSWIGLSDTDPADFTGSAGFSVVVNMAEDGLEFTKTLEGVFTFPYQFDTDIDNTPDDGMVQINNADPNLATEMYVHEDPGSGGPPALVMATLDTDDFVGITDSNGPNNFIYRLTTTPVLATNVWTLQLSSVVQIVGTFSNNEQVQWAAVFQPVNDFTDLDDVPATYAGDGGKTVVVNDAETGLAFQAQSTAFEFPYLFSTDTDNTPAVGFIQINNVVVSSANEFYAHQTTQDGTLNAGVVQSLAKGDRVLVANADGSAGFICSLDDIPVLTASVYTFTVELCSSAVGLANNEAAELRFQFNSGGADEGQNFNWTGTHGWTQDTHFVIDNMNYTALSATIGTIIQVGANPEESMFGLDSAGNTEVWYCTSMISQLHGKAVTVRKVEFGVRQSGACAIDTHRLFTRDTSDGTFNTLESDTHTISASGVHDFEEAVPFTLGLSDTLCAYFLISCSGGLDIIAIEGIDITLHTSL